MDLVHLGDLCAQSLSWPLPGSGSTRQRWRSLVALCADDLPVGRLVEAHADAAAICAELGGPRVDAGQRWGVWAAGPPRSVTATVAGPSTWHVTGVKPWCSGATLLTHALVTADVDGRQALLAVDLAQPGVSAEEPTWTGVGMAACDTRSVTFDGARATLVGELDSYLSRPGFWIGAIGVAACWHGGSTRVAQTLLHKAADSADPHLLSHLGGVQVVLGQATSVIRDAADQVDADPRGDHAVLARTVRGAVERAAVEVIDRVGRALGPGPLVHDSTHSALVADLMVYVRQHHAERDLEQLGRDLLKGGGPWLP